MEIEYFEKINKCGRLNKYAKFNDVTFSYNDKYYCALKNNKNYKKLHQAVYCFYNNLIEIPKNYCIHHIDENKNNNDIFNLQLLKHCEHTKLHRKNKNLSNEHKQKLSKINKGRKAWNKDIKCSIKTKQKISKSNKGNKAWNKGIPISDEQKHKMSISLKGKIPYNKFIPT